MDNKLLSETKKRAYVKKSVSRKKRVCIKRHEWKPNGMLADRMMIG